MLWVFCKPSKNLPLNPRIVMNNYLIYSSGNGILFRFNHYYEFIFNIKCYLKYPEEKLQKLQKKRPAYVCVSI